MLNIADERVHGDYRARLFDCGSMQWVLEFWSALKTGRCVIVPGMSHSLSLLPPVTKLAAYSLRILVVDVEHKSPNHFPFVTVILNDRRI